MNKFDVIVIGGGHNGLTTATFLAREKLRVLLLEKRNILGGVAAGEEFYPGYFTNGLVHDTSAVRSDVVQNLQLEKFGLVVDKRRPDIALLSEDGKSIRLQSNVDATAAEINKFSTKDGTAYRNYHNFLNKVSKVVNDLMDHPPPKFSIENLTMAGIVELARKGLKLKGLGNKTMVELLRIAPMCLADFLNELFETDFLKAGIAAPALNGSYAGPRSAYSTINLLLWECAARNHVVGGPQALINSLVKAATSAGVVLRKGAEVQKILLDNSGAAMGVRLSSGEEISAPGIAASCTPKETFLNLLDDYHIPYELEYWIQKIRSRGTTAKVNLALDGRVTLNNEEVVYARTGNSFDQMEKAFDPVKYGEMTTSPYLEILIPTAYDPALAPAGHSVISALVHQIPYHLKSGWTPDAKQRLGKNVLDVLERYSPGISGSVIGSEIMSPLDLENKYGLTEGHIYHGEHFVDQLVTRPIPSCMNYKTPIPGLFLCGSGSHPGGGITCAPGSMAANEIIKDKH